MSNIKQSLSWNMISFFIVGISGILINVLIGKFYGSEVLGAFNLIFAIYIFLSQLAVFGVHLSVLKYIASSDDDKSIVATSAIVITFFISFFISFVSLFIDNILGDIFHSDLVEQSWNYIAIGLFFFALNKTFLSIFNGIEMMRLFAIAQALRYIFALIIMSIFLIFGIESYKIGLVISISEILLFVVLIISYCKFIGFKFVSMKKWLKKHLQFGYNSFWGATIGELNTRVDTLILGIFVNDSLVGIYTLALMIFEGFVQIGVVLRNIFNPKLANLINKNDFDALLKLTANIKKKVYILFSILSLISIIIFPYFVDIVFGASFHQSIYVFVILMLSVFIASGYMPFDMILNQAGLPNLQSKYRVKIVLVNIILNFIMIPLFGIYGAAIATTIAFSSRIYFLNKYMNKFFNIVI